MAYSKIVDLNNNLVDGVCCQFSYKGYEISYTQIVKPYEAMIFPLKENGNNNIALAGPFCTIEDAIDHINNLLIFKHVRNENG